MTNPQQQPRRPERGAVLVTGSARRLGRAIALGMASDGWDIVVHYHRSADDAQQTVRDIQALGRQAVAIAADLSNAAQVSALFDAAREALPVNALVNNASLFEQDTPTDFDPARLHAHIGPNLVAPLQLGRRLFESLDTRERGVIVNILDQKLGNLNPDFFSYTLTKQALLGATRMMAMAFAPRLRVVGVSPGLTLPSYLQDAEAFEQAHRHTALLDKSSEPQDIVDTVVFLAAQKAITGVNLTVDGGQHLIGLERDVSYLDFGEQSQ